MFQSTVGTYLEDFLERIRPVPNRIKRELKLMADLDQDSEQVIAEIKALQAAYISKARRRIRDKAGRGGNLAEIAEDKSALEEIKKKRDVAVQKADEKVNITTMLYNILDHHIRKLDVDLQNFERTLRATGDFDVRSVATAEAAHAAAAGAGGGAGAGSGKAGKDRGRKRASAAAATHAPGALVAGLDDSQGVDPSEPVYCFCRRVYFGDMIGCDNDDCEIEWFHFECVGLTAQPAGKWYCPECKPLMKRQRRA